MTLVQADYKAKHITSGILIVLTGHIPIISPGPSPSYIPPFSVLIMTVSQGKRRRMNNPCAHTCNFNQEGKVTLFFNWLSILNSLRLCLPTWEIQKYSGFERMVNTIPLKAGIVKISRKKSGISEIAQNTTNLWESKSPVAQVRHLPTRFSLSSTLHYDFLGVVILQAWNWRIHLNLQINESTDSEDVYSVNSSKSYLDFSIVLLLSFPFNHVYYHPTKHKSRSHWNYSRFLSHFIHIFSVWESL